MNFLTNTINWQFLNEPLYRWAIFVVALTFITWGWNAALGFMH